MVSHVTSQGRLLFYSLSKSVKNNSLAFKCENQKDKTAIFRLWLLTPVVKSKRQLQLLSRLLVLMATRAKRIAGSFQLNMKRQQCASGASHCQTPVSCGFGVNLTSLILTVESVHLIFIKPRISFRSFFNLSFDSKVSAWILKVGSSPTWMLRYLWCCTLSLLCC